MRDCVFSSFVLWFECALKRDVYPQAVGWDSRIKNDKKVKLRHRKKDLEYFRKFDSRERFIRKKMTIRMRFLRMRFFDVSKVKESTFFKSDLTDSPSDFWCASFGNYRFKPFQISFFSEFYIKIMFCVRWFYSLFERMILKRKTMFIYTNHPLIISFYIKNVPIICRITDESVLIRNF